MAKSPSAFRTISEVSGELDVPAHVLRFWETKFSQVKPLKRGGGRRYYRPEDVETLRRIRHLLYEEKYTIKGVQKLFKENGVFPKADSPAPAQAELPMAEDACDASIADTTPSAAGDARRRARAAQTPPPAHARAGNQPVLSPNVRQLFSEIRGELVQVREILSDAALSD